MHPSTPHEKEERDTKRKTQRGRDSEERIKIKQKET
jgi:hypothetical protein